MPEPEPTFLESMYQSDKIFQMERAKKAAQGWQVVSVREEAHNSAGQATRIVVLYRRDALASQVQPPSTRRPPLRYPAGSVPESRQPTPPPSRITMTYQSDEVFQFDRAMKEARGWDVLSIKEDHNEAGQLASIIVVYVQTAAPSAKSASSPPILPAMQRQQLGVQKLPPRTTSPAPTPHPIGKGIPAPSAKLDKIIADEQAVNKVVNRLPSAHSTSPSQPATPQPESEMLINDEGFSLSDEPMLGLPPSREKIQPPDDILPPPPLVSPLQPVRTTTRIYNNVDDFLRDRPKMAQQGWKVVEEVEEWKPPFTVSVIYQRPVALSKPIPSLQPGQFQPYSSSPPPRRYASFQQWYDAKTGIVGKIAIWVIVAVVVSTFIGVVVIFGLAQQQQTQGNATPPMISRQAATLGGTEAAFLKRYGKANQTKPDRAEFREAKDHSVITIDYVGTTGDPSSDIVDLITVSQLPRSQPWSTSTWHTNCVAFLPSDAKFVSTIQSKLQVSGQSIIEMYYSADLANTLPASDFFNYNRQQVRQGTIYLEYSYTSSHYDSHIDSCLLSTFQLGK